MNLAFRTWYRVVISAALLAAALPSLASTADKPNMRYQDWKPIFMEQKSVGTFRVWMEPFVPLRIPLILNLRRDPYERATLTSNTYYDWLLDRAFLLVPAQAYVEQFLAPFKQYPPRQKAASFTLDQVMQSLTEPGSH